MLVIIIGKGVHGTPYEETPYGVTANAACTCVESGRWLYCRANVSYLGAQVE